MGKHLQCIDFTSQRKLTTHGVQPHKATDVVVKIHVPVFVTVSANDHLKQLIFERKT